MYLIIENQFVQVVADPPPEEIVEKRLNLSWFLGCRLFIQSLYSGCGVYATFSDF